MNSEYLEEENRTHKLERTSSSGSFKSKLKIQNQANGNDENVADAYRTGHRQNLMNMVPQQTKNVFDLESGGGGSPPQLLDKIPLLADDDESNSTKYDIDEENELAI